MLRSLVSPSSILLLDGIGAVLTAISVGLVLPALERWVGMPAHALHLLGAVALGFAIHSLGHHVTGKGSASVLRRVAFLNLSYCAVTTALLIYYSAQLRWLAWAYFLGEIAVVVALSVREASLARIENDLPRDGKGRR